MDNPLRFIDPDGMSAKGYVSFWNDQENKYEPRVYENNDGGDKVDKTKFVGGLLDGQTQELDKTKKITWKGKSFGQKFANFDRKLDGGDIATTTGEMTKKGWNKALPIIGTIASGGVALGAEAGLELGISIATLVNNVDDIGKNKNGESLSQQCVKGETGKKVVGIAKSVISGTAVLFGVGNISETIADPFKLMTTTNDAYITGESISDKKAIIK